MPWASDCFGNRLCELVLIWQISAHAIALAIHSHSYLHLGHGHGHSLVGGKETYTLLKRNLETPFAFKAVFCFAPVEQCMLQWGGFQLPAWCQRRHISIKKHTHRHTHICTRTWTHRLFAVFASGASCTWACCQTVYHRLSLCAHSFALSLYFWVRWHIQLLLVSSQKYSDWIWHRALLKKKKLISWVFWLMWVNWAAWWCFCL